MKSKKCKLCGGTNHTSLYCFKNRRSPLRNNHKYMKRLGKHGRQWLAVRQEWIKANPAEFYHCYYCGGRLTLKELTLDHRLSRSRRPDLRYDLNNLVPSCWKDNQRKGSKSDKEYLNTI